jgi:hypothetical protein
MASWSSRTRTAWRRRGPTTSPSAATTCCRTTSAWTTA